MDFPDSCTEKSTVLYVICESKTLHFGLGLHQQPAFTGGISLARLSFGKKRKVDRSRVYARHCLCMIVSSEAGDTLVSSRVERDLERFKEFIENRVKKPGPGEELFGNKLFI